MPPPNRGQGGRAGKGRKRVLSGNKRTETSPHILAALEAQRKRISQEQGEGGAGSKQARSHTGDTETSAPHPQIPGFVFNEDRGRYFRVVRESSEQLPGIHEALGQRGKKLQVAGASLEDASPACRRTSQGSLHSYVMNRRMGLCGLTRGLYGKSTGGPSWGTRAWIRSACLEAVVSSPQFKIKREWMPSEVQAMIRSMDHDERTGHLAVGFGNGCCRVFPRHGDCFTAQLSVKEGRGGGDGQGHQQAGQCTRGYSGSESLRLWGEGQAMDVKFRGNGNGWALAVAHQGNADRAGWVSAFLWNDGGGQGAENMPRPLSIRHSTAKVKRGSPWCVDWDPVNQGRLLTGVSVKSWVSFFDVERGKLLPIFQAYADVLSVAFLPPSAPGAGNAFLYGARNGHVVLSDSRIRPPRATVAGPAQSSAASEFVACFPWTVDNLHPLRDGRSCLAKDRSGGLQMLDLRVRGRGPVSVLKPSGSDAEYSMCKGHFTVDPSETLVASPIPWPDSRLYERDRSDRGGCGRGEHCPCAFKSQDMDPRSRCTFFGGERVRVFNIGSGKPVVDLSTPCDWSGLSLARSVFREPTGKAWDDTASGGGYVGEVTLWGSAARFVSDRATDDYRLFCARLRPGVS